jgi:hypothetical protein
VVNELSRLQKKPSVYAVTIKNLLNILLVTKIGAGIGARRELNEII